MPKESGKTFSQANKAQKKIHASKTTLKSPIKKIGLKLKKFSGVGPKFVDLIGYIVKLNGVFCCAFGATTDSDNYEKNLRSVISGLPFDQPMKSVVLVENFPRDVVNKIRKRIKGGDTKKWKKVKSLEDFQAQLRKFLPKLSKDRPKPKNKEAVAAITKICKKYTDENRESKAKSLSKVENINEHASSNWFSSSWLPKVLKNQTLGFSDYVAMFVDIWWCGEFLANVASTPKVLNK